MADPTTGDVMREYTPPIERIRDEYVRMRAEHYGFADLYAAEFDRALARVRAEAMRKVIAQVRAVYDLQCPVPPRRPDLGIEYVPGARMAHLWWQKVLGGEMDHLTARADRVERGESL